MKTSYRGYQLRLEPTSQSKLSMFYSKLEVVVDHRLVRVLFRYKNIAII